LVLNELKMKMKMNMFIRRRDGRADTSQGQLDVEKDRNGIDGN
jgi:hypothetical protein